MDDYRHPAEYSTPPPEYVPNPALEYPVPPPEYGQGSGPDAAAGKKKRGWRKVLSLPAILLSLFLCFESTPAAPIPDMPQGSVLIDVLYAARDVDAVRYCYTVYTPVPSLDATQEQIDAYKGTPYPISVYAAVSDATGRTVAPENDPDVWESSRSAFEYSVDASDLEGELTLTLTAVYTEEGEERQTKAVIPLAELPPEPGMHAELALAESGGIRYRAEFTPQPGDDHDYRLEARNFSLVWFDENGLDCGQTVVWDWDTLPTLSGSSAEGGYTAVYDGPAQIEWPNDEAVEFCARLTLWDETSRFPYTVDSNRIVLPSEPTLSGTLEVFPGGEGEAVFRLIPRPDDEHDYQLRVIKAGQEIHDNGRIEGLSLVDVPGDMEVTGDRETGFEVRYSGGTGAAMIPEGTQLTLYIVLVDDTDGKEYTISTNPVDPVERVTEYPTYPLEDGQIVITVYNDTLNFDVPSPVEVEDDYRTILAVDAVPEAEFTDYALPAAIAPTGFGFAGYVVHVGNPMDLSADGDVLSEYNGDPPVDVLINEETVVFRVGDLLTREDVERVPPSEDGVRYVNVHAVWIEEDPTTPQIFLDDGFGNVTGYSQNSPMYSEGFLYLCSYPVPEHPGMVFDGWYDENGNRVDVLVCYFSFTPMTYDSEGNFTGYDWDRHNTVALTARWKPQ